jgi:hypothetical protein
MRLKILWIGLLVLLLAMPLSAQEDEALVALRTDSTDLQTGEFYTIRIEVDNVIDLWSSTVTISYDPETLYIVGTKSGSPVKQGSLLEGSSVTIRNNANTNTGQLIYTPSRLAPGDPMTGSGVLGTFQVVPLQAGETVLSFEDAQLSRVIFTTDDAGNRTLQESVFIPLSVTQLTFSITGDPATPPPEETATPTPTATIFTESENLPTNTPEPTLRVVEDVTRTPESVVPSDSPAATGVAPLLIIAVALIVIALVGLSVLFMHARRKK